MLGGTIMGYLDKAGLSRAFTKLKTLIDKKADVSHKHVKADISDFPSSMPASDVYAWAKAATKPTYTKSEVGLGNVDNTADANKSVKYATSAGNASTATTANRVANAGAASANAARHVWFSDSETETVRVLDDNFKYNPSGNLLTANITGNAATATSVAWGNVSGKPSTFTPSSHTHDDRYYTETEMDSKLSGKANSSHTHNYAGSSSAGGNANWANGSTYANYSYNDKPITTAGTGAEYTASVNDLTLVAGASFVMVPHTVSTSTAPTLNVNSLGAKNIRMRISSSTSSTTALPSASFLTANKPVRLMYDGTYWIIDDMVRPDANNTYGTLISSGTAAPTSSNNGYIYIQYE
jgi:hypothetical protein